MTGDKILRHVFSPSRHEYVQGSNALILRNGLPPTVASTASTMTCVQLRNEGRVAGRRKLAPFPSFTGGYSGQPRGQQQI